VRYLDVEDIFWIHEQQIAFAGGDPTVLDRGRVESAVAQPQMTFGGEPLYPSLPEKAAALGFSLIKNHPFLDANKRTGQSASPAATPSDCADEESRPPMTARTLAIPGATVQVFPDPGHACDAAAGLIARSIREGVAARGRAVIGLATGNTPLPVYDRLAALHRAGDLSFADVSTYNLDEYYPIAPTDPRSYRAYMDRHLYGRVDLAANRAHIFDGTVPEAFAAEHAAGFDRWIEAEGGLDLQLLGVGRNGHIGFNEPSDLRVDAALRLPSRPTGLHPTTVEDAAAEFGDATLVPPRALTLGVAPILAARSILVLAFGAKKAEILASALQGPVTAGVPASLLRTVAGRVTWMIDEAAASRLG